MSARPGAFRPQTRLEIIALRIAKKLGDGATADHYRKLADQHTEAELLCAYRRTIASTPLDAGKLFHEELRSGNTNGTNVHGETIMAARVERRSIAVAILKGGHLEYTEVRQLSSDRGKALGSALAFVNWIAEDYVPHSAAIELVNAREDIQRLALSNAIETLLSNKAVPVLRVLKRAMFDSFGYPALRSRKELRSIVCSLWPVLIGSKGQDFVCDAVAIALHVEIEMLLSN